MKIDIECPICYSRVLVDGDSKVTYLRCVNSHCWWISDSHVIIPVRDIDLKDPVYLEIQKIKSRYDNKGIYHLSENEELFRQVWMLLNQKTNGKYYIDRKSVV